MRTIGFSTGALAYGEFEKGIELQRRQGVDAIELSALREHELPTLIEALPNLKLDSFAFKSFHAPSALEQISDAQLAQELLHVASMGYPIILHPDVISDFEPWRSLGDSLLLENMDMRKRVCRTARETVPYFDELPEAGFCFDIGHARQVDPTMSVAVDFLLRFRDRLAEVHISEVNWECKHRSISTAAALAFQKVARLIPESTPIIIESVIEEDRIDRELEVVRRCLDPEAEIIRKPRSNAVAIRRQRS